MCPLTPLAKCVLDAQGNVRSSASTVAGDGARSSRRTSSTKRSMRCHPPCLFGERPRKGIIPYIKLPFCQPGTACNRIPKKKEAKKKQRQRRFRSDEPGCPFSRSFAPAEYITYKRANLRCPRRASAKPGNRAASKSLGLGGRTKKPLSGRRFIHRVSFTEALLHATNRCL
jgi:hypothetical protein